MQDVVCEVGNDRGSLASRNLVVLELVDGEGEVGLLVFSARDCRLRAAARGRRGAGGRPCPCPRDVRGHVCWWSVSECRYATVWKKRTFADYRVWGTCALGLDRTDTRSRGTGARDRV